MMFHVGIVSKARILRELRRNGRIQEDYRHHPRLLLSEGEEEGLLTDITRNRILADSFSVIKEKAEGFLYTKPCQRSLQGHRLLSVSREILRRVFFLGFVYRLTGEGKYASRAIEEMLSASGFTDWNPSHFIDTSEMLVALSIGYDWLFHRLAPKEKRRIRKAIIHKGLLPSFAQSFWDKRTNWNSVCRAGVVMGAIAIIESSRRLSSYLIDRGVKSRENFIDAYYSDGCPEGCHYWAYTSMFEALMSTSLESSFGRDSWLGDGFDRILSSSRVVTMMTTPLGRAFSYGDSIIEAPIQYSLVWLAAKTGNTSILWPDIHKLTQERFESEAEENRLLPLLPLLGRGIDWESVSAPSDNVCHLDGKVPVFIYRSGWYSLDDTYLAVKGGRASDSHGHVDAGSFVFESDSVAWAVDLGKEDYQMVESGGVKLFDMSENSSRWDLFRCGAASHNLLTINGCRPSVNACVPIVERWDSPQRKGCALDTTAFYGGSLASCVREVYLDSDGCLNIIDTLSSIVPGLSLRWAMCTEADPETLLSGEIILRKDGRERKLVAESLLNAEPFTTDASPTSEYESANPGKSIVGFNFTGLNPDCKVVISVRLISVTTANYGS